jgi:hypothetical protein
LAWAPSGCRVARIATAGLAALTIGGCGSGTTIIKTVVAPATTAATATGTTAPARTADSTAARAPGTAARVGDAISLRGSETTLKVRVLGVLDPLAAGDYDQADAGKRYVGVRIALDNTGQSAYSDAVGNGSHVIMAGNDQAESTIVSSGPCGGDFQSDVKIAPGEQRVGCIPFQVPEGETVKSFEFTPDSGFANNTGEWDISTASTGGTGSSASSGSGTNGGAGTAASRRCDANIRAEAGTTTCPFAENVFYEYFTSGQQSTIGAYSPTTHRRYTLDCSTSQGDVVCEAGDGASVSFSQASVDAYTESQARAYAASHDVG